MVVAVILLGRLLPGQVRGASGQGAAFHVSEAGIDYILHLLNSGVCTPDEVAKQLPIIQRVPADMGDMGTFAITLASLDSNRWNVASVGREPGFTGNCQQIEADIEAFSGSLGTKYRIHSWGPQVSVRCTGPTQPTEVVCGNQ